MAVLGPPLRSKWEFQQPHEKNEKEIRAVETNSLELLSRHLLGRRPLWAILAGSDPLETLAFPELDGKGIACDRVALVIVLRP